MCVNALGRGHLLQSLITGQSTPLVGLEAAERVGRGTRLNGSVPQGTATQKVSSSPGYSTSSGSERESQRTPGAAVMSRTGGAVSSSSERECSSSPGGDVRTRRHSPGGSLSSRSVGGSGQRTSGAVLQEHQSPQVTSNVSSAVPETSPVQSLIKSRLPKHLKSSIQNTATSTSPTLDFVMPNTNTSNVQGLWKRSPDVESKPEAVIDRLD